jgi:hypothetical protein
MTYTELFDTIKQFNLKAIYSCTVYYEDMILGYYDYLEGVEDRIYYFSNGPKHFHKQKDFYEYVQQTILKIKKVQIEHKLDKMKEDFK